MIRTIAVLAATAVLGLALAGCSGDEAMPTSDNLQVPDARQLTSDDDVFEANPVVSPDGHWILFESDRAGNMDIWRMPVGGGLAEQMTTHPGFDSSPFWAPDGGGFVFESDRNGTKNIWILEFASPGAPYALTEGDWHDGSPSWSPDGTRVVYESNRERAWGTDLWISVVASGQSRRLTDTADDVYHRTADWSPDGTRIVFESNREVGQSALFTMSASGGSARRITALSGYEGHPAWSPRGDLIAFESNVAGTMEIYLIAAIGGKAAPATRGGGFWPRWSPDARSLVFGVYGEGEPNIWRVDLD